MISNTSTLFSKTGRLCTLVKAVLPALGRLKTHERHRVYAGSAELILYTPVQNAFVPF